MAKYKIVPARILPIGGDYIYFLAGPHLGNKRYRMMQIRKRRGIWSRANDIIHAIEDANLLDYLEDIIIEERAKCKK